MDNETLDAIIFASAEEKQIDKVLGHADVKVQLDHSEFCLRLSKRVAQRYLAEEIDFDAADAATNWLFAYSYMLEESPGEMPRVAREIFEAFDSGEFHHPGDDENVNPELKYTRPLLMKIVKKL